MSTNGNQWKPSKPIEVTCPSGQKVMVKRPGPELMLKTGKAARTFTSSIRDKDKLEGESDAKYYERIFDEMSDGDLAAYVLLGKNLVIAMCVSPKIVLNPRDGYDEIGPDDIGNDFWFLFNYGMTNFLGISVPVGETEVEAQDLDTFRDEPSVSGSGVDLAHLPVTESERAATDTGLVDSAGA